MDKTEEHVNKGTTTVGIVCKDGVVLGADKRVTLGGAYISHKSFYHSYTFENLFQQDYRYKLKKLKVLEKKVIHYEPPFDYDELQLTIEKNDYEQGEPR